MLKIKYKNQEYIITFKQGLMRDNQEIWTDLNFDMREIFINLNTPVIELKKAFKALAIKIVLLENNILNTINSEDIDKIVSILVNNKAEVNNLTIAFDSIFGGYFCSGLK